MAKMIPFTSRPIYRLIISIAIFNRLHLGQNEKYILAASTESAFCHDLRVIKFYRLGGDTGISPFLRE